MFAPAFHAPDVWAHGGWDITIMNPPYLGKKEVAQHIDRMRLADYKRHFGESNDLMILFARRARQLTKAGGVISMIFNDSIFTSTDAEDLRREMFDQSQVLVCARTRCFEGRAVNGGVLVQRLDKTKSAPPLRWVEGYGRPTTDFAAASDPLDFEGESGRFAAAGRMEVFSAPGYGFVVLPHRPLFRPSREAMRLLHRFGETERWATTSTNDGWPRLSNTRSLEREITTLRRSGWYDALRPGEWVLLGYVIEGGEGLATADNRHFLGALEGSHAASEHLAMQQRLEDALLADAGVLALYQRLRDEGRDREESLLAIWDDLRFDGRLTKLWPKGATFRIARLEDVCRIRPTDEERLLGIATGPFWIPYEKGDSSQQVEQQNGRTTRVGARWTRDNPIVIDWSAPSVRLLRERAKGSATRRKPYFRNERLWFEEGVSWNGIASFLRCRRIPGNSIFGDKFPLIRPVVPWMSTDSLLALLNTSVVDFLLRTFLSSRMNIDIGDVRRIPVPILSNEQDEHLSGLARAATEAKSQADEGNGQALANIEEEIDAYGSELYGVPANAEFWVVR